jgi:hypothetical protein
MNPQGFGFPGTLRLVCQRFLPVTLLTLLCGLLTGCPHNDYTVELKPSAKGVERTLSFYRTDGSRSNGIPNYQEFSTNELAALASAYPAAPSELAGPRYLVKGEFAGPLPDDIGGAGSYTNLTTRLGTAGFYLERFRGDDDLAAKTTRRLHAADQMTDLVVGWTQTEFSRERGYKKLHAFLDGDFRRDLKNAEQYLWAGQVSTLSNSNAPEEFAVRFGQYLFERGYLKLSDLPALNSAIQYGGDDAALRHLIQRLAAEKMGLAAEPLPKSFAVLNDATALEKSWDRYLARTDLYRAKLKEWKRQKKSDAKSEPPQPSAVTTDLLGELIDGSSGEPDRLTVRLELAHAPSHTNGKWQNGQVVWETTLDEKRALPVVCYASWSDSDAPFQAAHFGRVLLAGDALTDYCLWQYGLGAERMREWESFLAGLQPGSELNKQLATFQFAGEPKPPAGGTNQLNPGCQMLTDALAKGTETGSGSK